MAAVPSIGRATRVEGAPAPEADLTRALYEQYASQILRYCLHQLGSREEAEDAVQSTFLNAFRGIKRGIVPEIESAWLFKIAENVCLSRRRSTWRRGRIESPADFDVVEEVAPAPSRRADELIGLQDVLEQMPEQQRRAILLREWQGLSYREIGQELELSQSAVETLIFRARRSLAQGLEQPAGPKRKRLHAGALGNLLSSAQSFLIGGGAAVKVAATVAVVSAGTVVATAPVHTHAPTGRRAPAPVLVQHAQPASTPGGASGAVVPSAFAGGVQRLVTHANAHRAVHGPTTAVTPLVTPGADATPPAETPSVAPTATEQAPAATTPQLVPAPAAPASLPRGNDGVIGQAKQPGEPAQGKAAPPGQEKQATQDGPSPAVTTPADSSHGKDSAPGQQKQEDAPSQSGPAPAPAADPAPAQNGNGNGKADAPGQQKQNPLAAGPTPTPAPNGNGNGNGNGKADAPGPQKQDPPAPVATTPQVPATPIVTGTNGNGNAKGKDGSTPAAPVVVVAAPSQPAPQADSHGNGNDSPGNGKAKGTK